VFFRMDATDNAEKEAPHPGMARRGPGELRVLRASGCSRWTRCRSSSESATWRRA
jgi:hypothetical protein